jgi:hypothetical protein
MACLKCKEKELPPAWLRSLAQKYANDNACAVVLCKCSDWNFSRISDFDFNTKTATEIILPNNLSLTPNEIK